MNRLELEDELTESRLRETEGQARALGQQLALELGLESETVQVGDTLAVAPLAGSAATESRDVPRSLVLERQSLQEAHAASSSAGSAWLPTLEITGGLRVGRADETRYGYAAGVALSLPVFSRGQELRAEAAAQQQLARARVSEIQLEARVERARAQSELGLAVEESARLGETAERVERLVRSVQSAYREGERSVLELLDVERTRASVALRRLELALRAKRAELALRAARGEFE